MLNTIINAVVSLSLAGTLIYLIIRQHRRIEMMLGELDCRNIDGHNGRDFCGECLECTRSANKSLAKSMAIAQDRVIRFEQRYTELHNKIQQGTKVGEFTHFGILWRRCECPKCHDSGLQPDSVLGETHAPDGDPIPMITCNCRKGLELERLYAIATEHEGCVADRERRPEDCARFIYEWAKKLCVQHSGHVGCIFIPKEFIQLHSLAWDETVKSDGNVPTITFGNDSILRVYTTENTLQSADLCGGRWNFVGATGISDTIWSELKARATRSGYNNVLRYEPTANKDRDLAS